MLNGYITTLEAAQKWNISARQVQILCKNNRIEGAVQINRIWLIPANVSKPTNTYKYQSQHSFIILTLHMMQPILQSLLWGRI